MDPNNTVHHSDKIWGLDQGLHLRTDDLLTDSKVWLTPLILFYDESMQMLSQLTKGGI